MSTNFRNDNSPRKYWIITATKHVMCMGMPISCNDEPRRSSNWTRSPLTSHISSYLIIVTFSRSLGVMLTPRNQVPKQDAILAGYISREAYVRSVTAFNSSMFSASSRRQIRCAEESQFVLTGPRATNIVGSLSYIEPNLDSQRSQKGSWSKKEGISHSKNARIIRK